MTHIAKIPGRTALRRRSFIVGASATGLAFGYVAANAVRAAEDDDRTAVKPGVVLLIGQRGGPIRRGQLEQLVGDVDIDRLGDLHIAFMTGDHGDRDLG